MTPNNASDPGASKIGDSAAFILLSMLAVLVGFALAMGVGPRSGALVAIFFLGNPALWTALFVLGWRWHGRTALWLLLVAPFAFGPVVLLLLTASFISGVRIL